MEENRPSRLGAIPPQTPSVDSTTIDLGMFFDYSQWRATADEVREVLRPSRPLVQPEFRGTPLDRLQKFFAKLDEYIQAYRIPVEEQASIAANCFKGDALRWWQPFANGPYYLQDIKQMVLDEYDSVELEEQLISEFYGKRQAPGQVVAQFITEKAALAVRTNCQVGERKVVSLTVNLMRPELRSRLRNAGAVTITGLIREAVLVERDLRDEAAERAKAPQRSDNKYGDVARPAARAPNSSRYGGGETYARRPPVNSNWRDEARPPRPPANDRQRQDEPPRCHYCPNAYHWHRDCPRPPSSSGNAPRTVAPVRPPPSAPRS